MSRDCTHSVMNPPTLAKTPKEAIASVRSGKSEAYAFDGLHSILYTRRKKRIHALNQDTRNRWSFSL